VTGSEVAVRIVFLLWTLCKSPQCVRQKEVTFQGTTAGETDGQRVAGFTQESMM
jgi:hypothetical protein